MQFLIQGDRGIWVEYLQLALTRAGYPTRIDGIFGEHTCQALKDFTGNTDVCTVNRAVWEQLKPYLTGYRMHTIEKGDTVFGLSRRYGTTEEAILVANPLIDPDDLVVDAVLAIPLGFPLVPQMVKYTSVLTQWIVEGLVVRYPFLSAGVIGKSVMGKDIHSLWVGTGEKQVFYSASYGENTDGSEEPYFYTAYNMHWEPHAFALPNLPSGYIWHQVLDTAEDSMNGFLPSGKERHLDDQKEALVLARSIQVFAGLKCPEKKKTQSKGPKANRKEGM